MICLHRLRFGAFVLATATLAACVSIQDSSPRYYPNSEGLPFSEAVQVGDMLYLAGQIGAAPGANQLVEGGMEAEARQIMDNIGAILARRGLDFEDVVKCTVMLADMDDWPAFNRIYVPYFNKDRLPARSAFATSGLAYNGRLEVECWAFKPKPHQTIE